MERYGSARRLARQVLTLLPVALALGALYVNARAQNHFYGFDFHGGTWRAAHEILAGRSPYPPPNSAFLLRVRDAFIPPPLLALLAIPFAPLPWPLAITLWNLVSIGALIAALRLLGVNDRRVYPLAICSFPFVCTIGFGQTEALLALGLAAAWSWRADSRGALAVGALIAAKLLVWPLAVWLLLTRGIRSALIAVGSAAGLLALSWATIGFRGLLAYPKLLAADARAFGDRTHSIVSALSLSGTSRGAAQLAAVLLALIVVVAILRIGGVTDRACFAAAIAFSLFATPLLEMHYLTLLLIPLAVARPRADALWLFAANVFWLSPHEPTGSVWQIALVLLSAALILLRASRRPTGAPAAALAPAAA